MIPKIIHYCWFGGKPFPPLAEKCMESWHRHCLGWQIMRWDETNFDPHINAYAQEAYDAQKWAFVSDVARLWALKQYGGFYLDTDVELIKPLDCFLEENFLIGLEFHRIVATSLIGAAPENKIICELLSKYDEKHFLLPNGQTDRTANVKLFTSYFREKCGRKIRNVLYKGADFSVYPSDYFSPKDSRTGFVFLTKHSSAIHHFSTSWYEAEELAFRENQWRRMAFLRRLRPLLGANRVVWIGKRLLLCIQLRQIYGAFWLVHALRILRSQK
ncbi:MAG: glycosyl transferase [Oscillospiraceae bacterium]|jgi:hypothetical protein|nr:glycosyl transferase [Oscillospiraceae bacterium]